MSDVSLPTDPRKAGPGAGVGAPSGRGPEATYRGAGEAGGGPDVTADGRADAIQASGGGTRQTLGECSVTATRQTLGECSVTRQTLGECSVTVTRRTLGECSVTVTRQTLGECFVEEHDRLLVSAL